MKLFSFVLCAALVFAVMSCAPGKTYPGGVSFDNPFCQEVTLVFHESGGEWIGEETISNAISEDYELETIQIMDPEGLPIDHIRLSAPLDDDGDSCPFYYPSSQGAIVYTGNSFEMTSSGSTNTYTAENVAQRRVAESMSADILYCPPEKTLGLWTLKLKCPSSHATSSFSATVTLCFEYKE